jgi:hypothetical protein
MRNYFLLGGFVFLFSVAAIAQHGGAEAPAAAGDKKPITNDKPWLDTMNEVMMWKTKREQALSNLTKAREEVHHLKEGSGELNDKFKEMNQSFKDYRIATQEYNHALTILKYRYPDRLEKEKSDLAILKEESKEELEKNLDIDGKLGRVLKRARSKYGEFRPAPSKSLSKEKKVKKSEFKTIREEDPIIIEQ